MAKHLPEPVPCPKCGADPSVEECAPWPKEYGRAPWYVGCYRGGSNEHFVGVNGDTRREAIENWNREARVTT